MNAKNALALLGLFAAFGLGAARFHADSHAAIVAPADPDAFDELVIPVGAGPASLAIADVNHDGHPDILVANTESQTLTVLLGDGHGHFHSAPGAVCATGPGPNDIAIGDFNGDGNLDLAIANTGTPNLTILLGDGKGGFTPAAHSPFATRSKPHVHGVAVGDFNGDGKLDVVTDDWGNNQFLLLLGDGLGNLASPGVPFPTGKRPYQRLRSADFNRDGRPDVVTTNLDGNTVSILSGDGHGGFANAAGSPFPAGAAPWAVAVADMNGDGNLDLVVVPYDRDVPDPQQIGVTVLLGDGRGGFRKMRGSPFSLAGCAGPDRVATGDIKGDGIRDIVVSCAQSNNLVFFMGTKDGGYRITSRAMKDIGWSGLDVADLNGDGKAEVVVANHEAGTITILFGK